MSAKLTQEFVDAWLAENRPDFKPVDGWVYSDASTPIPGSCRVCGADDIAPRLYSMKDNGQGHCNTCRTRAAGEANRARGEAEIRRVAAERGYEVVCFFTKQYNHSTNASGVLNKLYATLRCGCGNEWDLPQSSLCSQGTGCASCAEFGYSTDKPGAMYLLVRTVDGVEQRQYGISNDWKTRTAGYKRFGWRLKDVVIWQDGSVARRHEDRMNALVREVGRTVEPDSVYYRCAEAFVDGVGIPMFVGVHDLLHWLGEDNNAQQ
jgi:hypothetical protein